MIDIYRRTSTTDRDARSKSSESSKMATTITIRPVCPFPKEHEVVIIDISSHGLSLLGTIINHRENFGWKMGARTFEGEIRSRDKQAGVAWMLPKARYTITNYPTRQEY